MTRENEDCSTGETLPPFLTTIDLMVLTYDNIEQQVF